jgi:2-polyprenyl-3-methyl-5-hydroxy-6-metoxy-1,4-benzoquinol methylase
MNTKFNIKNDYCNYCLGGEIVESSKCLGEINNCKVFKCRDCNLIYIYPKPNENELHNMYQNWHGSHQYELNQYGEKYLFNNILLSIKKRGYSGKILDIGSSYGFFLDSARKEGFTVKGLEIANEPFNYSKNVLGLDVDNMTLDEANYPDNNFDILTMLNVLEHVSNPFNILCEAWRITKSPGLILIVVPNALLAYPYFILSRKLGVEAFVPTSAYTVPSHLTIFSPFSIKNMLTKSGWKVVSIMNAPVITNKSKLKTSLKYLFKSFGDIVQTISFKKICFGYSILIIGEKSE